MPPPSEFKVPDPDSPGKFITNRQYCKAKSSKKTTDCGSASHMTAKETCDEVQKQSSEIVGVVGKLAGATPFGALTAIFESDQKMTEKVRNNLKVVQKDIKSIMSSNVCVNLVNNVQSNVMSDDGCNALYDKNPQWGAPPPGADFDHFTQSAKATVNNTCEMKAISAQFDKMETSVENSAALDAVQKLTGGGKQSTDQDICNNVDSEQTACSFLEQDTCCANIVNTTQTNLVHKCSGHVKDTSQSLTADLVSKCTGTSKAKQKSDLKVQSKSSTGMTGGQTEDDGNTGIIIGIVVVVVLVLGCIGGYIWYTEDQKKKQGYEKVPSEDPDVEAEQGPQAGGRRRRRSTGYLSPLQKTWRKYKLLFLVAGALFVIHITNKKN
jgi:hypothetical protein